MKVTLVEASAFTEQSSSNHDRKFIGVVKGDEVFVVYGYVDKHKDLQNSSEYVALGISHPEVAGAVPMEFASEDPDDWTKHNGFWSSSGFRLETPQEYRRAIVDAFVGARVFW